MKYIPSPEQSITKIITKTFVHKTLRVLKELKFVRIEQSNDHCKRTVTFDWPCGALRKDGASEFSPFCVKFSPLISQQGFGAIFSKIKKWFLATFKSPIPVCATAQIRNTLLTAKYLHTFSQSFVYRTPSSYSSVYVETTKKTESQNTNAPAD